MNIYEKNIIGGIVAGHIKPSETGLTSSDLTDEVLSQVLLLTLKMESEGKPLDADTVYQNFIEQDSFGWLSANDLTEYAERAKSIQTVNHAIEKINERNLKSNLTLTLETLLESSELSGGAILDRLRETVNKAESEFATLSNNFEFVAEFANEQAELYKDLHEGKTIAVPTYFTDLDRHLLDGFAKGDLHIIVGMTGSGKSSLALNCAIKQARHNFTVGYVSREMSKTENLVRFQAMDTKTPRWQIRKHLRKETLETLTDNLSEIKGLRIAFDTKTADIESLRLQTKLMVENHGLDILYVDYLNLMRSNGKHSTRANEVQTISRNLKEIAMELNIPVVALCQFNRGVINAPITEVMNYLKESSGIEQDASTITVIQTEKSETDDNRLAEAKAVIVKNRNGATFKPVPMQFDGEIFTFFEVTGNYDATF